MSEVTLTGLTQLEAARLRFQLGGCSDPFIEAPVTIETSLAEVIAALRSVSEALYPVQPGTLALVPTSGSSSSSANTKSPRTQREPKAKREPSVKREKSSKSEKPGSGRGYVNWYAIVKSLLAGEIDEYVCTQKATSAATTKSNLVKKFPGLDVEIETEGPTATVTVQLGDYDPDARARA